MTNDSMSLMNKQDYPIVIDFVRKLVDYVIRLNHLQFAIECAIDSEDPDYYLAETLFSILIENLEPGTSVDKPFQLPANDMLNGKKLNKLKRQYHELKTIMAKSKSDLLASGKLLGDDYCDIKTIFDFNSLRGEKYMSINGYKSYFNLARSTEILHEFTNEKDINKQRTLINFYNSKKGSYQVTFNQAVDYLNDFFIEYRNFLENYKKKLLDPLGQISSEKVCFEIAN